MNKMEMLKICSAVNNILEHDDEKVIQFVITMYGYFCTGREKDVKIKQSIMDEYHVGWVKVWDEMEKEGKV